LSYLFVYFNFVSFLSEEKGKIRADGKMKKSKKTEKPKNKEYMRYILS